MNKNVIIGLLGLVVLVGIGFYISSNNKEVVTPIDNSSTNITVTPTITTPTTTQKADAPVVQTSLENGTSVSTASVNGHVKPNGASTTYWFEYGSTTALGNRTTAQAIGSGFYSTPTPGFITGLKANTLYYFRLSAKNQFGTVNGETYSFQTNNNPAPKGVAPISGTNKATSVDSTSVVLNGQVNPNGAPTNYWFEYGRDTNFGYVTDFKSTNSGSSLISVPTPVSGLEPLTKFYFRINAQNQYGTVNGTTMSFTTIGPAVSSKPTVQTSGATNVSATDATFVGNINPNGSETTYWFEYSNDSLLNNLIGSGTPKGTLASSTNSQVVKINVNGLGSNTKYYYHLVARNQNGTVYGDAVSFTTKK
jgi:phosphodiesterase/alkaline phosphatase D-like protein